MAAPKMGRSISVQFVISTSVVVSCLFPFFLVKYQKIRSKLRWKPGKSKAQVYKVCCYIQGIGPAVVPNLSVFLQMSDS